MDGRLESEGLVHAETNRGVVVRGVSLTDLAQMYVAREPLEVLVVRLVAERAARSDAVDRLERSLELQRFLVERGRLDEVATRVTPFTPL